MAKTILVVDDNAIDRSELKGFLEEKYSVTEVDENDEILSVRREKSAPSSTFSLDILSRQEPSEAKLSDERYKELFENINGGVSVVICEDNGAVRLAYANNHYYKLFGYTKEQLHKELKDSHEVIYPDDRDKVAVAIAKIKKTKQAITFRYEAKTGNFKYAPKTGTYLKGTFDERPIWQIFAEDQTASDADIERVRKMITEDEKPCNATWNLMTPDGTAHPFLMKVVLCDVTEDDVILITLTDRK